MNRYLLFLLLLTVLSAKSQTLTVTIDASRRRTADTLLIKNHKIPVHPGRITTTTFHFRGPVELEFASPAYLGANDSIHVRFDPQQQQYAIDGGRYPDNYHAWSDLIGSAAFPDMYSHPMAYDEYVRDVDSTVSNSLARIKVEKERGSLSRDVADLVMDYLKYKELAALILFQSKTHTELLPLTHSTLYPMVGLADFQQDRNPDIRSFIPAATTYLRYRFGSPDRDSGLDRQIDFAIDSLGGDTRARVLYSLIVETGYKPKDGKAAFTAVYNRIRALHLAGRFNKGIEWQYDKAMREHQKLGSRLLNQPLLRTPTGKSISLRSILDTCQDKDVFVKFAEFGMDVREGGYLNIQPVVSDPRIITIDLYTSFAEWRRATKERILTNEFYLEGGLKGPLPAYLFINRLPTWVALDRTGDIDDIDISLEDMFRYNLAGQ